MKPFQKLVIFCIAVPFCVALIKVNPGVGFLVTLGTIISLALISEKK